VQKFKGDQNANELDIMDIELKDGGSGIQEEIAVRRGGRGSANE